MRDRIARRARCPRPARSHPRPSLEVVRGAAAGGPAPALLTGADDRIVASCSRARWRTAHGYWPEAIDREVRGLPPRELRSCRRGRSSARHPGGLRFRVEHGRWLPRRALPASRGRPGRRRAGSPDAPERSSSMSGRALGRRLRLLVVDDAQSSGWPVVEALARGVRVVALGDPDRDGGFRGAVPGLPRIAAAAGRRPVEVPPPTGSPPRADAVGSVTRSAAGAGAGAAAASANHASAVRLPSRRGVGVHRRRLRERACARACPVVDGRGRAHGGGRDRGRPRAAVPRRPHRGGRAESPRDDAGSRDRVARGRRAPRPRPRVSGRAVMARRLDAVALRRLRAALRS